MRKTLVFSAILLGTFLVGTSFSDESSASDSGKINEVLKKFERTGKTSYCLSTHRIDSIRAIDDRHLIISVSPRISYLSKLPFRCSGLSFHEAIAYRSRIGRICSSDTFRVFRSSGHLGAACGFGIFEKLRRKPRKTSRRRCDASRTIDRALSRPCLPGFRVWAATPDQAFCHRRQHFAVQGHA